MKVEVKIIENVQGKLLNYLILQEEEKKVFINIGEKTLAKILELQLLELQNEKANEDNTINKALTTH